MTVRLIDGNKLIEWFCPYLHTGEAIPADVVIEDIRSMPTLTSPNESRMINADILAKRIAGHSNYHGDSILAAIYCAAEGKENDVPIRPIQTLPNDPLTCEGCACESYPRDCYPCNTCNRNDETLSDQYRPPEEEVNT